MPSPAASDHALRLVEWARLWRLLLRPTDLNAERDDDPGDAPINLAPDDHGDEYPGGEAA
jgi:hypothetical protein